jgi:hypothetical protein
MMRKLYWQWSKFHQLIGWSGMIGLAGLFFVLIYFFTTVSQTHQLVTEALQKLSIAKAEHDKPYGDTTTAALDPHQVLKEFVGNFPDAESINVTWEHISKVVEQSGLTLDRSMYESSPEERAGLLRYHLQMPVKATYPQIRDFIATVIQTTPNLALENIYISLVLYVKAP